MRPESRKGQSTCLLIVFHTGHPRSLSASILPFIAVPCFSIYCYLVSFSIFVCTCCNVSMTELETLANGHGWFAHFKWLLCNVICGNEHWCGV